MGKVPTPGGVTSVPADFNPKLMMTDRSKLTVSPNNSNVIVKDTAFPPLPGSGHVPPKSTGAIPKRASQNPFTLEISGISQDTCQVSRVHKAGMCSDYVKN